MDKNFKQLLGRESRILEEGSQRDILMPRGATVGVATSSQNDINSNYFQFGHEFQSFVLSRLMLDGFQKSAYRLRTLNKSAKDRVEKGIEQAKISLLNIQNLAESQLSSCIKNIDVFMRGTIIQGLQNLIILSPVHFRSIKNINLFITGDNERYFFVTISESLILKYLNITNKSNLQGLCIRGKYEVVIQDCTFNGLTIKCEENAQVSVVNSRFINTVLDGFRCYSCDSLFMDQNTIKDCRSYGCCVLRCGNVSIDNIEVVSCGWHGIIFSRVNGFKLHNAFVQDCRGAGIWVELKSVGEIQNVHIQGCRLYGIEVHVVHESTVRYAQIKFDNNEEGEFHIQEGCQFLRMD